MSKNRRDWKLRILTTVLGDEESILSGCVPEFDQKWEINVWLHLFRAGFPTLKISSMEDLLSAKNLGGMVGHKLSALDALAPAMKHARIQLKRHGFSYQQLLVCFHYGVTPESVVSYLKDFKNSLQRSRRALRRCVSIATEEGGDERSELMEGYRAALTSGTLTDRMGFVAETEATQIYQFLAVFGHDCQERLTSLTELHAVLSRCYGEQIIGTKERVRKLCNRLEYKIGRVGRSSKKRDIESLMLSLFPSIEASMVSANEYIRHLQSNHAQTGALKTRSS